MLIFGIIFVVIVFWGNGIIGIENNEELLNQVTALSNQVNEKDILILQYKKEILNWTIKYKNLEEIFEFTKHSYVNLEENYELTKHSLDMANDILNKLDKDLINDLSDYE